MYSACIPNLRSRYKERRYRMVLLNNGNFCFQLATDITADMTLRMRMTKSLRKKRRRRRQRRRRRRSQKRLLRQRMASALPHQRRLSPRLQRVQAPPLRSHPRGSAGRCREISQEAARRLRVRDTCITTYGYICIQTYSNVSQCIPNLGVPNARIPMYLVSGYVS